MNAFGSERVVVSIDLEGKRHKAFQILFGPDKSLYVNFPYFAHRKGIVAAATIPANCKVMSQVDLKINGKIASHFVKYSHHPDGRAHFSQDGKIRTEIKRQSLDQQNGHIFSVIKGIQAFEAADAIRDVGMSPHLSVLRFRQAKRNRKRSNW